MKAIRSCPRLAIVCGDVRRRPERPKRCRPLNAFTIDVEDYFHVAASVRSSAAIAGRAARPVSEANTERLLALLGECGIRGTFFVLGWVAERTPQLVRRIAAAGQRSPAMATRTGSIYSSPEQEFREETRAVEELPRGPIGAPRTGLPRRELLGHARVAVGAGCAHRPRDSATTHRCFPSGTIFTGCPARDPGTAPVAAHHPGARWRSSRCRRQLLRGDGAGVRGRLLPHPAVLGDARGTAADQRRSQRPFAFYLHPWEIDPGQPRIEVEAFSRFRHYTNLVALRGTAASRVARIQPSLRWRDAARGGLLDRAAGGDAPRRGWKSAVTQTVSAG